MQPGQFQEILTMPSKLQCIVASCPARGVFKDDRDNITLYKFPEDEKLFVYIEAVLP